MTSPLLKLNSVEQVNELLMNKYDVTHEEFDILIKPFNRLTDFKLLVLNILDMIGIDYIRNKVRYKRFELKCKIEYNYEVIRLILNHGYLLSQKQYNVLSPYFSIKYALNNNLHISPEQLTDRIFNNAYYLGCYINLNIYDDNELIKNLLITYPDTELVKQLFKNKQTYFNVYLKSLTARFMHHNPHNQLHKLDIPNIEFRNQLYCFHHIKTLFTVTQLCFTLNILSWIINPLFKIINFILVITYYIYLIKHECFIPNEIKLIIILVSLILIL